MNKILIIEDEASMTKALKDKLSHEGYEVISSKDGEDGLNKALEEHPDLILLDIIMPKMDGLTVLKKLREDEWGKNAEVIILTNLSDNEEISRAISDGKGEYLIKTDWKMEDIVNKVKSKLNK